MLMNITIRHNEQFWFLFDYLKIHYYVHLRVNEKITDEIVLFSCFSKIESNYEIFSAPVVYTDVKQSSMVINS